MELSNNRIGNNVTLKGFCATIIALKNEKNITYSECV